MYCTKCGKEIPDDSRSCAHCGKEYGSDAMAKIVPYKNVPALIAYYFGIFSLIPCLGFLLSIPAFILGFIGLKKASEVPSAYGKLHAYIGIVIGILVFLAHLAVFLVPFVMCMMKR